MITIVFQGISIQIYYADSDPIWRLTPYQRELTAICYVQSELEKKVDVLKKQVAISAN